MSAPPFLLTLTQLRRLSPHFPRSHGVPRVDDRRVVSGIIYVIRHRLQWRDAPPPTGRTSRSTTASCAGAALAYSTASSRHWLPRLDRLDRLMIDSTHLKAPRTAASMLKKGLFPAVSAAPRAA